MPAKKNNSSGMKIGLYAAILLIAAIILYFLLFGRGTRQDDHAAIPESMSPPEQQVRPEASVSPPTTSTPFPEEADQAPLAIDTPAEEDPQIKQCLSLSADIKDFFSYLDSQPYIASYELQAGSRTHFKRLLEMLFANPPTIPEKKEDLFVTLSNAAHFYRVLGAKNIMLVKDYLEMEEGRLEYDFNIFFQWAQLNSCSQQKTTDLKLPLEDLFRYATFFLSTPGGKSYLNRRSPRSSLLVQYFSILTADLAFDRHSNPYFIDLLPSINAVLFQLQSEQILENQPEYLATLKELRLKYLNQLKGKKS